MPCSVAPLVFQSPATAKPRRCRLFRKPLGPSPPRVGREQHQQPNAANRMRFGALFERMVVIHRRFGPRRLDSGDDDVASPLATNEVVI